MIVKRVHLALSLYLLASVPFFLLVALPVLHGTLSFQFYMDSPTYHAAAEQLQTGLQLITISSNYLGPVLIIKLLGGSYGLIYLFNVVLFLATYAIVAGSYTVDRTHFVALLFMAPLTFTSLFSVNKEVVAVLATVLFAASYTRRKTWWRWMAIALSIFARWQMTLALFAAWLAFSALNPFRRRRGLTLVLLVGGISIAYPANLDLFSAIDRIAALGALDNQEGSGLYSSFIGLQNHFGGYLLAFLPKAAHLFVGMVARWSKLTDTSDVMNNIILWLQSLAQLTVLVLMIVRRRLRLSSDLVFLAGIIAAVITLSPIFSTRYLLPVYALFAIELAIPRSTRDPHGVMAYDNT